MTTNYGNKLYKDYEELQIKQDKKASRNLAIKVYELAKKSVPSCPQIQAHNA